MVNKLGKRNSDSLWWLESEEYNLILIQQAGGGLLVIKIGERITK
jgi:hypothetical protein